MKKVITFLVFIFAFIGGKFAYDAIFTESDTVSFEEVDWLPRNQAGISFEAPFELSSTEIELPQTVRQYVKDMQTYKYDTKAIGLFVSKAEYIGEIKVDLDGAVQGAMQNIKLSNGVSDLVYNVQNISKNYIPGRRIEGKLKMKGEAAEIVAELYGSGSQLIQIMCTNLDHIENQKVRDRIFTSITLN